MNTKIAILENEAQAREYLNQKNFSKEFVPITLSFEAEEFFRKNNIQVKTEEDYEKEGLYRNLHEESMKLTWKICKNSKFKYSGIDILPLFYYKIFTKIARCKKNLRLIKEIIQRENPQEILVFQSEEVVDKEYCSRLMGYVFKKKVIKLQYTPQVVKNIRDNRLIKLFGKIQKIITKSQLKLSKDKKKIFISGGELYFKNLALELIKNKKNSLFNFGGDLRRSFFVKGGYLPFYEFSRKPDRKTQEKIKEIDKIRNLSLDKILKSEKKIAEVVMYKIQTLLKAELPGVLERLDEFRGLLEQRKINIILLSEEGHPFSRGIIQLAKQFNIPTITLQHGLFGERSPSVYNNADFYLVMGQYSKKLIQKFAPQDMGVIITGTPRYDSLKEDRKVDTKKQITYLMEVANEDAIIPNNHLTKKRQKEVLAMLFNIMKTLPEYQLILKTRPNWELKGIIDLVADNEDFHNFEVIERTNNNKLINESKILIINHTTMGLEALFLGKPTISVSYKDLDKSNPYRDARRTVPIVYNKKSLEKEIIKIIHGKVTPKEKREKYLKKHIFKLDHKASLRAEEFIEKLLLKR